jgi:hypothetical protein
MKVFAHFCLLLVFVLIPLFVIHVFIRLLLSARILFAKVRTPNSALDLQLSQLLIPIIAQNLERWVHIDQDDLNKINICSQCSFRTSTNKILNPYNFCVQYPNCVFFSALESSCICQ